MRINVWLENLKVLSIGRPKCRR